MTSRSVSVTGLAVLLLLAGCTGDEPTEPAAVPGPLAVSPDDPDGVPLPPTDVFGFVVGLGDDGTAGVVWADTSVSVTRGSTRIGLGTDPADWTVAAPEAVLSYQDVGTPAVAADGTLAALAVVRSEEANNVLTVLRMAPDGTVTTTPVPDTSFSRYEWSDVDAVSDDGRTAVVVEQLRDPDRPDDPPRLEVTSIDLATATLVARTVVDVPTGAQDVEVGPDGAVTVLLAGTEDGELARLLRFDRALQRQDDVPLEPADVEVPARVPQLALTPDGTAVVTLVDGELLTGEDVVTRVLTVAPGGTRAETVAELADTVVPGARRAGNSLLTAIDGWAYLFLRDGTSGPTVLTAVDLSSGEVAAPVPTCDQLVPEQVTRSGSGRTVAAVFSCLGEGGDVLLTLGER